MSLVWSDSIDGVDWNELSALFLATLGAKDPSTLRIAFSNSMLKWFVYDQGKLVGVGRVVSDGIDVAYLCDIAVMPSHQGIGLGGEIITRLLSWCAGHKKILLYAVPGKEPLYRKYGFARMDTAMAIFENQPLAFERGYLRER